MHTEGWNLRPGYGLGGIFAKVLGHSYLNLEFPSDEYWMFQALSFAMNGIGIGSPNPEVGCVIVSNNRLISFGVTEKVGHKHAETIAIEMALNKDPQILVGSTLFVTLEPCSHSGHQPPCVNLIERSGISRVVYGSIDPNPMVNGKGIDYLKSRGIKVHCSRLYAECQAWHYPFIARCLGTSKEPLFFGKWAQTIDGMLADDKSNSQWITGSSARKYGHWLRQKYDAIMIGVSTLIADEPLLTVRDCEPIVSTPLRIISDPKGRLLSVNAKKLDSLSNKIFSSPGTIYLTSRDYREQALQSWLQKLTHKPLILINEHSDYIQGLKATLDHPDIFLAFDRKISTVYVEGGSVLLSLLLRADLIEACHVFIATGFLGGNLNRIFKNCCNQPELKLREMRRFQLIAAEKLGGDLVMEFGKLKMMEQ